MIQTAPIWYLAPFILLAAGPIVLMLVVAIRRDHKMENWLAIMTLLVALLSVFYLATLEAKEVYSIIIIDSYSLFYTGLLIFATLIVTMLSFNYLERYQESRGEYYMLLLTGLLGATVIAASHHFASLFLGLEILSVSLYGLIAYIREQSASIEAGIKYLILAAASSAILLFGIALIYTGLGSMHFRELGHLLADQSMEGITMVGAVMVFIGAAFKLALVPFHMWTPDVYQGASAPATAFLATVSKGAVFAFIFRIFTLIDDLQSENMVFIVSLIAIASMLAGNFLALLQQNVKRILAYSSIAHLGYLMVALIAGGQTGMEAGIFYLLAYIITILGAFGILSLIANEKVEGARIEDFNGLFWKHPWMSFIFTAMLLSLAGIPLTAGFIGKFYLVFGGVQEQLWTPVVVLLLSSVVGLFYYLRIVVAMIKSHPLSGNGHASFAVPVWGWSNGIALGIVTLLLIGFGVFPQGILELISQLTIKL